MQTITHEERKILELVFSEDEANIELAKSLAKATQKSLSNILKKFGYLDLNIVWFGSFDWELQCPKLEFCSDYDMVFYIKDNGSNKHQSCFEYILKNHLPLPQVKKLTLIGFFGFNSSLPSCVSELGLHDCLNINVNQEYFPSVKKMIASNCKHITVQSLPLNLEHLEITASKLRRLPDQFPNSLKYMDLSWNKLERLPTFVLPNLKFLNIQGNGFEEMPDYNHIMSNHPNLDLRCGRTP